MAGLGRKTFTAGEVLTAANVQGYLQDQVVQYYASAAARSSALGTAVSAGMVSYRADGTVVEMYNGSAWVAPVDTSTFLTASGTATLTNKTLTSPIFSLSAIESVGFTSAFAGATVYVNTNNAVQMAVGGNATSNGTLNITSTSGQTLNTLMSIGQSLTFTYVIQNGGTAYYPTAIQVDGSTPSVLRWAGGTAPASGNANAFDAYTFTIVKYGSAQFYVLASATKFA
jgi:hypothetical protein